MNRMTKNKVLINVLFIALLTLYSIHSFIELLVNEVRQDCGKYVLSALLKLKLDKLRETKVDHRGITIDYLGAQLKWNI